MGGTIIPGVRTNPMGTHLGSMWRGWTVFIVPVCLCQDCMIPLSCHMPPPPVRPDSSILFSTLQIFCPRFQRLSFTQYLILSSCQYLQYIPHYGWSIITIRCNKRTIFETRWQDESYCYSWLLLHSTDYLVCWPTCCLAREGTMPSKLLIVSSQWQWSSTGPWPLDGALEQLHTASTAWS